MVLTKLNKIGNSKGDGNSKNVVDERAKEERITRNFPMFRCDCAIEQCKVSVS